MKKTKRLLILAALAALAVTFGAASASRVAGASVSVLASLPTYDKQVIQHAIGDYYLGNDVADVLDTVTNASTFTTRGYVSSNNVITFHGKRPGHASVKSVFTGSATYPSGAVTFFLSDSKCANITGTAATTLVVGSAGGYIPLVAGKSGVLLLNSNGIASLQLTKATTAYYPCAVLPNGRVVTGSQFSPD